MKQPKIFLEEPQSSKSDQDFSFLDKGFDFLVQSEEEAIASLEKLLIKKKVVNTDELTEKGYTPNVIQNVVSKGKAIFRTLDKPAQLVSTQLSIF